MMTAEIRIAEAFLKHILSQISSKPLSNRLVIRRVSKETSIPVEQVALYAHVPDEVPDSARYQIVETVLLFILERISIVPLELDRHLEEIARDGGLSRKDIRFYTHHLIERMFSRAAHRACA